MKGGKKHIVVCVGVHSEWLDRSDVGNKRRLRVSSGDVVEARSTNGGTGQCECVCVFGENVVGVFVVVSEAKREHRSKKKEEAHKERKRSNMLFVC